MGLDKWWQYLSEKIACRVHLIPARDAKLDLGGTEARWYDIFVGHQVKSTVATGTAPLTVASTTVVANLNADKLDGNEATAFAASVHTHAGVTALTDLDTDTYNDSAAKVLGTDADGGVRVDHIEAGNVTGAAEGEVAYAAHLRPYRNATSYTGFVFVPLATRLTSTSWDGDAKDDIGATLLDLSAVFGVPAGIKAVALRAEVRDSGAGAWTSHISFGPTAAWPYVMICRCPGSDVWWTYPPTMVPCDANGDIYYTVDASGPSTLDVDLTIHGYCL